MGAARVSNCRWRLTHISLKCRHSTSSWEPMYCSRGGWSAPPGAESARRGGVPAPLTSRSSGSRWRRLAPRHLDRLRLRRRLAAAAARRPYSPALFDDVVDLVEEEVAVEERVPHRLELRRVLLQRREGADDARACACRSRTTCAGRRSTSAAGGGRGRRTQCCCRRAARPRGGRARSRTLA